MTDTSTLRPAASELHRPTVTRKMLKSICDRIVQVFNPEKVILFGSYAYGAPNSTSDVDLLVIVDSPDSLHDRIVKITEVARVPFLPMDVVVRTPAEIEERLNIGDHFILDVLTNGKVLYDRDAR